MKMLEKAVDTVRNRRNTPKVMNSARGSRDGSPCDHASGEIPTRTQNTQKHVTWNLRLNVNIDFDWLIGRDELCIKMYPMKVTLRTTL